MVRDGHVGSGQLGDDTVKLEQKAGSDFSGNNGQANRTLTLTNVPISSSVVVFIDGSALHYTDQYTVSGSTLTIIDPLDNDSQVDIRYFTVG